MENLDDVEKQKANFYIAPMKKPMYRSLSEYLLNIRAPSLVVQISEDYGNKIPSSSSDLPNLKSQDDLYTCIRPLLRFGRCVGLMPISGLLLGQADLDDISFSKINLAGITTSLVIIAMILHLGIRFILAGFLFRAKEDNDLVHIAETLASVNFATSGAYMFYFMYRNTPNLISCLYAWRHYKRRMPQLYDQKLQKDINIVAGILLTSAILQNFLSHWNIVPSSGTKSMSILEIYYHKHFPNYSDVIGYSPIVTLCLFICDKWCVYAWTFGDILVAVIARAFYKQFEIHLKQIQSDLGILKGQSKQYWVKILEEHENIIELLDKFNSFLRPLIFACVFSNIYFIAITLNRFLVSSPSSPQTTRAIGTPVLVLLGQVNSIWSFLQLLAKTFTTIVYCARVNAHAHSLEGILGKCPISSFNKEVERTELKMRTAQIGFTGLDYFTITKPFVLTVFNVLFTLEIVLLQSAATSKPPT